MGSKGSNNLLLEGASGLEVQLPLRRNTDPEPENKIRVLRVRLKAGWDREFQGGGPMGNEYNCLHSGMLLSAVRLHKQSTHFIWNIFF